MTRRKKNSNKLVYASFCDEFDKPEVWFKIDPHGEGDCCFAIDRTPLIQVPSHLDLFNLSSYATLLVGSKVYFIGGVTGFSNYKLRFSNQIFIYHLISKTWEVSPYKLNVARGLHKVALIGNIIYVLGGRIDILFNSPAKENWTEYFNLDAPSSSWKCLTSSPPPDALYHDFVPYFHFVYPLGNQILFCMPKAGFYSFNYLSKSWSPFHENLNKYASVICYSVVVIHHILFWHYYGVISAYDLKNNRIIFEQRLDKLNMSFGDPDLCGFEPDVSCLVRVANDNLVLMCWDGFSRIGKQLHLYKFQIENLSQYQQGKQLRLVQIGCGVFASPDAQIQGEIFVCSASASASPITPIK